MFTFVPNLPIPVKRLDIGTFVTNASDPLQEEKHKPSKIDPQIVNIEVLNYNEILSNSKSKSIQALLTNYLSASASSSNADTATLTSWKAASYQLEDSNSWFRTVCADPDTQKWLAEQIGRESDVYLLVGSRTLFDGNVEVERKQAVHKAVKAKVPVDKITGLPLGLDAGGEASSSSSQGSTRKFMTQGESIWALQYRKIKFKWFFSKSVDEAFLEAGSRWKIVGQRSDEDEEDIVEVVWEDEEMTEDMVGV